MKLCMEVNSVRIKIVWKEQLCKHKVSDFCYSFPGPETFQDLWETSETCTLIDHRNDVIKCSKLKWNHELQASGFTAKFWTFHGVISMVYNEQVWLWTGLNVSDINI